MTDRDAMLRCILESPDQDFPRLVFADWCEENGESERAEFVRVQVELARWKPPTANECKAPAFTGSGILSCSEWNAKHPARDNWCEVCSVGKTLRRRERELWDWDWDWHWQDWIPQIERGCSRGNNPASGILHDVYGGIEVTASRGFIASLTLSWSDWLAHEAALYWSPGQETVCLHCNGSGAMGCDADGEIDCTECRTRGRVNRPFVATAQPLERVRLTTWPDAVGESLGRFDRAVRFNANPPNCDIQFDRVKCPTCDGWEAGNHCRDCTLRGAPLNEWQCDKWPTITFAMPEAEYRDYATADFTTRFGIPPELIDAREEATHG